MQSKWKGALKATRNMGKGLHKVSSTIVKEISQELTALGESGSEVSHFIPEPRNFAEVTKLSENIRKPWLYKHPCMELLVHLPFDNQSGKFGY